MNLLTLPMTAGDFHALDVWDRPELGLDGRCATVLECDIVGDALVMGSGQRADTVDLDACRIASVAVVRRRSGGGAVLVEPGAMTWFDVVVPADDPSFASVALDVGASMRWLGNHLATALASVGVGTAGESIDVVGSMHRTSWSATVCFAGLGPGEIVLDGRKLIGVSQRRTRAGSRFQCSVHQVWHPERLIPLLAEPRPAVAELAPVATLAPDLAAALPAAVADVLAR